MTIVLPHGVLFRGGEEGEIRKNLIEQNNIDAIIGLPANIFSTRQEQMYLYYFWTIPRSMSRQF